jgi:hypothetical protein
MATPQGNRQSFVRDGGNRRLAEAPRLEDTQSNELDAAELVSRLEEQAAENGRLQAQLEAADRIAGSERDARRRVVAQLKRERKAAAALHERAQRDREAHVAAVEELECVRRGAELAELHVQQAWTRLSETERRLAYYERGLWARLLRRPLERG